ncbi:VOC family protein [Chitinimonas naiadis]
MATVRYLVNDVDAALRFYMALGFELSDRWGPPFAIVTRGDLSLWLSGPGTSAAKTLPNGNTPVPGGWNRLVLEVSHLDNAVNAIRQTGAHLRSEPVHGPGGRQVLVDDPSGNPVELFEARPAPP